MKYKDKYYKYFSIKIEQNGRYISRPQSIKGK